MVQTGGLRATERHHLEICPRKRSDARPPPASCRARNPASPDELCRAESVPSATLTPRFFISGIRVGCRSGVPRETYAAGHQTIDKPERVDRLHLFVADEVHVHKGRVRPEHADARRDARNAIFPSCAPSRPRDRDQTRCGCCRITPCPIGNLLRRDIELVGCRSLAVQRDVPVHDAVLVPIAKQLAAEQVEATVALGRHSCEQGLCSRGPGSRP